MTKEELLDFRKMLVNAKPVAMQKWPNGWCIVDAMCPGEDWWVNCTFGEKGSPYYNESANWVRQHTKSPDDIARVFDLSIAAIDRRIARMK